jgi:hypothetical protein
MIALEFLKGDNKYVNDHLSEIINRMNDYERS